MYLKTISQTLIILMLCFVGQTYATGDHQTPAGKSGQNAFAAFWLQKQPTDAPQTLRLRLGALNTQEMRGFGMVLHFNPDQYEFIKVYEVSQNLLASTQTSTPLSFAFEKQQGELYLASMNVDKEATIGEGAITDIIFRIKGTYDPKDFTLADGIFIDLAGATNAVNRLDIRDAYSQTKFKLGDNTPNPFNPMTVIPYTVSARDHVQLTIFNILGQEIRTLVNETIDAGSYTLVWDGHDASNRPVASGTYFYRLDANGFSQTKRMMLLK